MKNLRKLLIVGNLILVPIVSVVPNEYSKIIGAFAVGLNAGAAYLIKEGD